jgi:FkbM family methyltransferase
LVRRGDVVFDVGANRGIFTSYFSNLVGAMGIVHAFEPSAATCEVLRESLLARTIRENVIVNCCAVGEGRRSALLRIPGSDDGQASLMEHRSGTWAENPEVHTEACEVISLDDYVESRNVGAVDIVKIDVEGAERLVIDGFRAGLRRFTPILVVELCSRWSEDFGYQPAEVIGRLRELGYDRFGLVGQNGKLIGIPVPESAGGSGESVDVVCSLSSIHQHRIAPS